MNPFLMAIVSLVTARLIPNVDVCTPSNTESLLPLVEKISWMFTFQDAMDARKYYTLSEIIKFYGYGKQAIDGDINEERPGIFDVIEGMKWDAWNAHKGLEQEEAALRFLGMAGKILEVRGNSIDNARRLLQEDYEACVERKLSEGQTM